MKNFSLFQPNSKAFSNRPKTTSSISSHQRPANFHPSVGSRRSLKTNFFLKSSPYSQRLFSTTSSTNSFKIPRLEIIDSMVQAASSKSNSFSFEKTAFIGVQHILETTGTLFQGLIDLGAKPNNMYFGGKCYSTSQPVAQAIQKMGIRLFPDIMPQEVGEYQQASKDSINHMWERFIIDIRKKSIEKIIILDDGGRSIEQLPDTIRFKYPIAVIEQTRGGLYNRRVDTLLFPLIEVASSAVKCLVEPAFIATAVLNKVKNLLLKLNLDKDTVCGVVGNGAIGSAIVNHLLDTGFKVMVYDENPQSFRKVINKNCYRVKSAEAVIANTSCIFGCTGKDITKGIKDILELCTRDKIFISCTSEDREFLSLLKIIDKMNPTLTNPLSDISFLNPSGGEILIKRGGYPINFDNEPRSVPTKDIAVTRGLLLGACLQAATVATKPIEDGVTINDSSYLSLDPHIQRYVINIWKKDRQLDLGYQHDFLESFENIDWIIKNSGGSYRKNQALEECFNDILSSTLVKDSHLSNLQP